MTRIHFLHGAADRHGAAANWLAQTSAQRKSTWVLLPDQAAAERFDRLLWMQSATGFIPHCFATDALAAETPIRLTIALDAELADACLVNLTNETPNGFSRFEELIEFISVGETDRLRGRERYRYYREHGYELLSKDISGGIGE